MRDFLKEVSAMKKSLIFILCGIVVLFLTARVLIAQDPKQTQQTQVKQEQKTAKVSEEFLNTWKKVGDKTKEIRSFKTEKAITVAGVRGAEAEDEALKYLYFKGGVKYPSRLELKNAVEMLDNFILENPRDSTIAQTKFFIAQCYIQLGETEKGISTYNELVEKYPNSDCAAMAKDELKKIKK